MKKSIPDTDFTGLYLVIMNYGTDGSGNAAPRFLHLSSNRGRIHYNTNGETHGHCTVDAAFGVAAVDAQQQDYSHLPAPNRWSISAATAPGAFSIIPMAHPLPRVSYTTAAGCG